MPQFKYRPAPPRPRQQPEPKYSRRQRIYGTFNLAAIIVALTFSPHVVKAIGVLIVSVAFVGGVLLLFLVMLLGRRR